MAKKIAIVPTPSKGVCQNCGQDFDYVYRHGKPMIYCLNPECIKDRQRKKMATFRKANPQHIQDIRLMKRIERDSLIYKRTSYNRAFADWFSGLFDGEGTFRLRMQPYGKGRKLPFICSASLEIKLRYDDMPILEEIQTFFGTGKLSRVKARTTKDGIKHNPQGTYSVYDVHSLYHLFIPHFDKHPLRAKKKHDYEIWREGVVWLYTKRHIKNPEGFMKLVNAIREVRYYEDPRIDTSTQ